MGLTFQYVNHCPVFLRGLVRFGLAAVTGSVAAGFDAPAFVCLLASMYFCRFSGNPRFLAALCLALVKDLAASGVRIVKPYFFLYAFALMP